MTSKNNPVHVLGKLPLSRMSTFSFRESFKVLCRQILLSQSRMKFDCLEEILKFLTQSKVFLIESIYIYTYARSQNCENRLLASSCLSVCLSIRPQGTTQLPLGGIS